MVTGILIFLPALYFFILSFQMCLLQKEYGFLCFNPLRREQQDSIRQIWLYSVKLGKCLSLCWCSSVARLVPLQVVWKRQLLQFSFHRHYLYLEKGTHQFFGRQIPDDTIRNAATIFLMYIVLFLVGGMVISRTEDIPLMTALFETASAIGTVGLSLGITPDLGLVSHIILICLMFLAEWEDWPWFLLPFLKKA